MDDHIQQLRYQSKMFWDAFQKAANEVVWLRQQNAELVEALRRVIAVADRDTEDFRFAKATIAKATGGE